MCWESRPHTADGHGMEEGPKQHQAEDAGALVKRMVLVLKLHSKESSEKSFPWQR